MAEQSLPRWRVVFPIHHVVVAELAVATMVLAMARLAGWVGLVVAIPAFIVAGLHYRGATAVGWLGRFRADPDTTTAIPEAFSVELPGVGPIGMRYDGQYAITMIALHGREFPRTLLVPEGADTPDVVPLDVIGSLLRQFGGLELHCVDAVSVGSRVAPDGRYTPCYDEIVGDRPAVGERRTWLVLRLCPQGCLRALVYRGDVGVATAAATERIRQAVVRAGCRATTCSADQLNAATTVLLGGHEPERFEHRWNHLRAGNDYVTSYRIAGIDLNSRLLGDLWTIRSTKTVTVLRLTRTEPRDAVAEGYVSVAALVRLHTPAPLTHPPLSTLHSVNGQQFSALWASLPLGNRALGSLSARPLRRSTKRLADRKGLLVPIGPSGPMLGMSSADGVPVLMPLTDPLKFVKIAIDAEIEVIAALVLRATAAGDVALVHTDRPEVWEPICDNHRMLLAGVTEPASVATLVVADGETAIKRLLATSGERGHAVVALTGTPPADCDIVITQTSVGELTVDVGQRRVRLSIMRPRNETQFLNHLRSTTVTT